MRTCLAIAILALAQLAPAQQHTSEAPQIIEGPQAPGTAPSKNPDPSSMSNDSVLRMHAAGLGDDLIVQTIKTQPGRYDTDPDTLIALKKSGLSDDVLAAMANKARRQITNVDPAGNPPAIELSPVNEI